MASYQLLSSHSDHHLLHSSSSSSSSLCSKTQLVGSKAQNCFFKILRIISTVPPVKINTSQKLNEFSVDLNIGFDVPTVTEESGSQIDGGFVSLQSCSTADEKNSVAAELGGVGVSTVDFEKLCKSDTCVVQLQSTENQEIIEILKVEKNESKEEIGQVKEQNGFMGLLIEAAILIFGDFIDENPKSQSQTETKTFKSEKLKMDEDDKDQVVGGATKKQLKRRNTEEETKTSYPLIRSKRGRIQVLPNKYRDSILEPLTPLSRIRSTTVPNRRRSK